MISVADFIKMTPEEQKALDPLEALASALAAVACQIDEARQIKDAGSLLHAISITLDVADQLEAIGAKLAAKVVAASLKSMIAENGGEMPKEIADKLKAHGVEVVKLSTGEESPEKDDMEFTLGMPTMKPAKA